MKKEDLKWKRVEKFFSKDQRFYNGKFLLLDLVLNDKVELSYFKAVDHTKRDEIYVNFDRINGIIYPRGKNKKAVFDKIKNDLENEYIKNNGKSSSEFILEFSKKYHLTHPTDMLFSLNDSFFDKFDNFLNLLD